MKNGWIGVDLDGTLARDDMPEGVYEPRHIGQPIPEMVARVKQWLSEGKEVRIFTARITNTTHGLSSQETVLIIQAWCSRVFGRALPVTCTKDFKMQELWDDRAVQVEKNTGRRIGSEQR